MFDEFNSDENTRIIADTSDYVPLKLSQIPTTEQQTDSKKKILHSLSNEASEKLKT